MSEKLDKNILNENELSNVAGGAGDGVNAPMFKVNDRVSFTSSVDGSTIWGAVVSVDYMSGEYMYTIDCDVLYKGSKMARVSESSITGCTRVG